MTGGSNTFGFQIPLSSEHRSTMHPLAFALQNLDAECDNVRFLARVITQQCLPKTHKFYRAYSETLMLQYFPNNNAPTLKPCFDFIGQKIPSNCFHSRQFFGKDLPEDIIKLHEDFKDSEKIRPMGRYIIVSYTINKKKRKHSEFNFSP